MVASQLLVNGSPQLVVEGIARWVDHFEYLVNQGAEGRTTGNISQRHPLIFGNGGSRD